MKLIEMCFVKALTVEINTGPGHGCNAAVLCAKFYRDCIPIILE